ncbi:MAG: hypothetical protein V2I37_14115 [Marinilabiliaceae bacterium]|jgi:hypothetical protein|nr:hypothetical protein [Marinilabiliaceae bacterium]
MKSMLRIGMVILLSVAVNGVFAQERGQGMRNMDPEAQADQQVKTLKEIVKVDKKEEAKLKEVFLNAAKERTKSMQAMRDSGDREGMREKMTEMNKKRDEEIKKVLGEERMKTYLEELEKRRPQRQGGERRN